MGRTRFAREGGRGSRMGRDKAVLGRQAIHRKLPEMQGFVPNLEQGQKA